MEEIMETKTYRVNLAKQPLSPDELGNLRRGCNDSLNVIRQRVSWYRLAVYFAGALGFLDTILLWQEGWFDGRAILVPVLAIIIVLSIITTSAMLYMFSRATALACLGVFMCALTIVFLWPRGLTGPLAAVGAAAAMLAIVSLFKLSNIAMLRKGIEERLHGLAELDSVEMPIECLEWDTWRNKAISVKTYANTLASLGRRPTRGEYLAAKAWMAALKECDLPARKDVTKACARMTQTI